MPDYNKGALVTHTIFSTILAVFAAITLGLCIYAHQESSPSRYDLNYQGSNFWSGISDTALVGIIFSSVLLGAAIAGIFASSCGICSKFFLITYIVTITCVAIALFVVGVILLIFASGSPPSSFTQYMLESWQASISPPIEPYTRNTCFIQQDLDCMGFNTGDCFGCTPYPQGSPTNCTGFQISVCPPCSNSTVPESWSLEGCYEIGINEAQSFYLPGGIFLIIVSVMCIVDVFLACYI